MGSKVQQTKDFDFQGCAEMKWYRTKQYDSSQLAEDCPTYLIVDEGKEDFGFCDASLNTHATLSFDNNVNPHFQKKSILFCCKSDAIGKDIPTLEVRKTWIKEDMSGAVTETALRVSKPWDIHKDDNGSSNSNGDGDGSSNSNSDGDSSGLSGGAIFAIH